MSDSAQVEHVRVKKLKQLIEVLVSVVEESESPVLQTLAMRKAAAKAGVSVSQMPYVVNSAIADHRLTADLRAGTLEVCKSPKVLPRVLALGASTAPNNQYVIKQLKKRAEVLRWKFSALENERKTAEQAVEDFNNSQALQNSAVKHLLFPPMRQLGESAKWFRAEEERVGAELSSLNITIASLIEDDK